MDDSGKRLLIDDVVDVIAASRSFPYPGVQLQVIKALLTAVSSNTCHVRGDSLLTAVGSIFHVQLEVGLGIGFKVSQRLSIVPHE